jgi:hypothetical protein
LALLVSKVAEAEIGRILDNFERLAKKWAPKPRKPKAVPKSI